ncbi:MAG: hypothetical protein ABIW79_00340 [Gemmatimonas sp.]
MHYQSNRQLQERITSLPVPEVLEAAIRFFVRRSGVYSAFVEKQGPTYVVLRGQGGEEIAIGARVTEAGTSVSGSTYLFDAQVAQFLGSLPPASASVSVAPLSDDQTADPLPPGTAATGPAAPAAATVVAS